MGNRIGNLCLCSAGAGDTSDRLQNNSTLLSQKLDRAVCNSVIYVRSDPLRIYGDGDTLSDESAVATMSFCSVSSAAVSANSISSPSIFVDDSVQMNTVLDSSASFESFGSFVPTMIPLSHYDRMTNGDSVEDDSEHEKMKKACTCKIGLKKVLSRVFSNAVFGKGSNFKRSDSGNGNGYRRLSSCTSLSGDDTAAADGGGGGCENYHMARGKGGEDRVHIILCEDHGWIYVGIYDGFTGPDATDFLLKNMFGVVHDELKGFLCNRNGHNEESFSHSDVLEALSEALRKTEDAFLKIVDEMITRNPVLAMMGSCVLVMLMKGEDVYLMNVGDSRAVLATQTGNPFQLTVDHNAHAREEVRRIRQEHPDDALAITNGRVKGYLNITRAFGAGFLKQPKQNDAMLETFKVNYIGESPYITCSPSLHHHRLCSSDKFLILSSDGLYQYFTNEEAVTKVELFITRFPYKNPAQLLIEEALYQVAKKYGMEFHELLDISHGERRRYHDDITVVIISLEGKIWRS
ncbi:probable protein phosphatase 2C 23 [Vicia villosa]|uniref:probable protein phosphatase 2C 23 n=1 Tax=Vicia villosa TaxID=3911 RepID=UPI00273CB8C6|nr:probable protein phosphatase 2C 23 [Vicia villosa]